MGGNSSRQRLSDCPNDDKQADKSSWRVSEFGSFLKISVSHKTPREPAYSTSSSSRQDSVSSLERDNHNHHPGPEATQFTKSQPAFQESRINGGASALLNTTPSGHVPPPKTAAVRKYSPATVFNSPLDTITPLRGSIGVYSSLTPELTPSEAQRRKKIIAHSFLVHMHDLIDQVMPDEAAGKLYGIGILNISERQQAEDKSRSETERAMELVQLVKWKLWRSPEWFVDVCKILRNCGVKVVSQIIDEVYNECPAEEMSVLSTISGSTLNSVPVRQTSQLSYYDMIKNIEASLEEGGRKAASARILKYTSEQGVDVELVNQSCTQEVGVSTLELLLSVLNESGDNRVVNSKTECGRTPLHQACAALVVGPSEDKDNAQDGNAIQRKKIEVLLSNGANHCTKDKDGNTPLHLAVLRCDCDCVATLLRCGGRRCINIVNKCGNTALHVACRRGRLDIVKVLCTQRANTSTQNNKSKTALHLACFHNHIDTAQYLANHDQSTLDGLDRNHRTPLHICCKRGNSLLALTFLKLKNCTPFKLDRDNKTPLHYAVAMENIGVVTSLLQKDAETPGGVGLSAMVNAIDRYGDTALHIASRLGNKPIAKQLLNFKADDNIANEEGKTALEVAIDSESGQFPKKMLRKRNWNQRRKINRRIKLRRTLTQSTLASSYQLSEASEIPYVSSSESEEDENYSNNDRRETM